MQSLQAIHCFFPCMAPVLKQSARPGLINQKTGVHLLRQPIVVPVALTGKTGADWMRWKCWRSQSKDLSRILNTFILLVIQWVDMVPGFSELPTLVNGQA